MFNSVIISIQSKTSETFKNESLSFSAQQSNFRRDNEITLCPKKFSFHPSSTTENWLQKV